METYKAICVEDKKYVDGDKVLELSRGEEYVISKEEGGMVTVFSKYWATVPSALFSGEVRFT